MRWKQGLRFTGELIKTNFIVAVYRSAAATTANTFFITPLASTIFARHSTVFPAATQLPPSPQNLVRAGGQLLAALAGSNVLQRRCGMSGSQCTFLAFRPSPEGCRLQCCQLALSSGRMTSTYCPWWHQCTGTGPLLCRTASCNALATYDSMRPGQLTLSPRSSFVRGFYTSLLRKQISIKSAQEADLPTRSGQPMPRVLLQIVLIFLPKNQHRSLNKAVQRRMGVHTASLHSFGLA